MPYIMFYLNDDRSNPPLLNLIMASIYFTFLTFAAYLINDLNDIESDRLNPFKRKRPLAAGTFKKTSAKFSIYVFIMIGCIGLFDQNPKLAVWGLFYILLNILYTKVFKKNIILSAVSLSLFHLIRFCIGMVVGGYPNSALLILFIFLYFFSVSTALHKQEFSKLSKLKVIRKMFFYPAVISIAVLIAHLNIADVLKYYSSVYLLYTSIVFLILHYYAVSKTYFTEVSYRTRILPMITDYRILTSSFGILLTILYAKK